jgi:hypothetical protein
VVVFISKEKGERKLFVNTLNLVIMIIVNSIQSFGSWKKISTA